MTSGALSLFLATLAGAAGLFASDQDLTVGIDQMVLDGKGRIVSFSKAWSDKLIVFEDGRWNELPLSPADKPSQPRGLLGLRDGHVASVWSTGKNEWVLAILDGNRIAQKIPFAWGIGSWDFFSMAEDSSGRIWLSGGLPEVVRCDPATGTARAFDLAPLDTGPPKKKWNTVFVTEDLRGRLWLWTSNRADNYVSLPRPVRVQDDSLELLPDIPGFTGRQPIVDLRVRDNDSLWIGARKEGLFVLNLDPLSVEPVPEPEKNAFRPLDGIFPFGNGWLVVAGVGSRMRLWQLADGKWTQRVPPDQFHFMQWNLPAPACLDVHSGAVLAADKGIVFVPHDGEGAKLLDWRNGWTLGGAAQFLSLGGDRFAALSHGGTPPRWVVADLRDYLAPRPQSDAEEILPWRGWTVDAQDRVFTLLHQKTPDLSVWEKGSWRKIPLPTDLKADQLSHVEFDSQNRLWFFSDDINLPVGILSADLKTWETQPDYQSALVRHREDMDGFAKDQWWLRPITGPGGQIAFRTQNWEIKSWDGKAWHMWKENDIGPFSKDDRVSTPFFDGAGRLCVNTLHSDKTWKLGDDQKWTASTKLPGIADMWTSNSSRHVDRKLPDGFSVRDIRDPWVATDNLGVTWVAGNSNLYKCFKGRTVAVFDGKTVHPFLRNPPIHSVRVDRLGNTWLQLGMDSINHILLPAKKSGPPSFSVKVDSWGLAELSHLPEGTIEWRLDRGDWRTLRPGEKSLGFLPSGDHEVEFQILTDRLDRIGPISKKIPVAIASSEQIAHLIAILRDGPDQMRELAVIGLVAQPSQAIPALKAARAKSDFWWLQAALQECER